MICKDVKQSTLLDQRSKGECNAIMRGEMHMKNMIALHWCGNPTQAKDQEDATSSKVNCSISKSVNQMTRVIKSWINTLTQSQIWRFKQVDIMETKDLVQQRIKRCLTLARIKVYLLDDVNLSYIIKLFKSIIQSTSFKETSVSFNSYIWLKVTMDYKATSICFI